MEAVPTTGPGLAVVFCLLLLQWCSCRPSVRSTDTGWRVEAVTDRQTGQWKSLVIHTMVLYMIAVQRRASRWWGRDSFYKVWYWPWTPWSHMSFHQAIAAAAVLHTIQGDQQMQSKPALAQPAANIQIILPILVTMDYMDFLCIFLREAVSNLQAAR